MSHFDGPQTVRLVCSAWEKGKVELAAHLRVHLHDALFNEPIELAIVDFELSHREVGETFRFGFKAIAIRYSVQTPEFLLESLARF